MEIMSKHRHGHHQGQPVQSGQTGGEQATATAERPESGQQENGHDQSLGLGAAVSSARALAGNVYKKVTGSAKAVDKTVHESPYKALGVALAVGALLGFFLARRGGRKEDVEA